MLIEKLTGKYIVTLPTGIIIDIGGVGYGVEMPLSVICNLPPKGSRIEVFTYTYVREDAIKLYGFLTYRDRLLFEILIGLNQVGPRVALAMLSTLEVEVIVAAAREDKAAIFEAVPGIGKRLAEKIKVDLKPKLKLLERVQFDDANIAKERLDASNFEDLGSDHGDSSDELLEEREYIYEDLRSALSNLGYKEKTIAALITKLKREPSEGGFQELMRKALREIQGIDSKKSLLIKSNSAHSQSGGGAPITG